MSASNYLEDAIMKHVLGRTTFTAAATLYYALYTVSPSDAGGGTEVSGGSYARQAKTNNTTEFVFTSGVITNGTIVNFGTAGAPWGTIGYAGVLDATSGGNLYFWTPLVTSIPIVSGDSLTFPVGSLSFIAD